MKITIDTEILNKYNLSIEEFFILYLNYLNFDISSINSSLVEKGIVGNIRPISSAYCDFGKGFYMGTEPAQPLTLVCDEKAPQFYTVSANLTGLKILNVD